MPVLRLLVDLAFLGVCIAGACYFDAWWAKALMVIPASVAIARLFVIGHDACHGSYTKYDWLNKIVGRIAFLPSLTPFSLWDVGHNVAHHGFTNLKGRDQVWVPMSAEEWQTASKVRRALERIYRSGFGQGLYYLIEMWWKKLILPTKKHVGVRRAIFWWDNLLVLGVGAVWITALVLWAVYDDHSITWTLLGGFVLPFLAFNCIMGFVIYVQHTHPEVAWFDKREEWQKRLGFITTTVNVVVPKRMGADPARHPRARRAPREHGRAAVPAARGADCAEECGSAAGARVRAELEALLGDGAHLQALRLREPSLAGLQGTRDRAPVFPDAAAAT